MALWDWFLGLFNKDDGTVPLDAFMGDIASESFYKDLAIQSCVNLIANAVARSEFLTFDKGKEIKGENYYLFNVEPNLNKASSKFWRDVVHKLVYENECLVIQEAGRFYVADGFEILEFAFKENIYKNVIVSDYDLRKTYIESQVFHFELHNQEIKALIEGLYQSYSKLISVGMKNYKKNSSRRGKLEVPTSYMQTEQGQKMLEDLLGNKFKRFFDAEGDSVVPITNGMNYEELKNTLGEKSGIGGRDVRAFIDDIFDFVAMAFQVPPQLLKGNVSDTDKAVKNFLTFCVNPLAELLTDEINRKLYGKKMFLEKTYVKLDTSRIRAVDIKDIASALDILTRIGAYSVDDSLKALGMEPLETEWSQSRWMTKNYESIETRLEGGV